MIHLRALQNNDAVILSQSLNNPNVIRYLSSKIPHPYTIEDANWFINTGSAQQAYNQAILYHGQFCGVIGVYLKDKEYAHTAEIGYWVSEQFWGKGIATRSVRQFCELLFTTTDIRRIFNPVTAQNTASIRVMEKAGFILEGILKQNVCHQGILADEHLFALVK